MFEQYAFYCFCLWPQPARNLIRAHRPQPRLPRLPRRLVLRLRHLLLPAVPMGQPPPFSAAQKLGMFAFAKNNQSQDQQLRDEYDCYGMVQQQTGINPEASPARRCVCSGCAGCYLRAGAENNAPQAKGGRARGAARGAVGGAVIGGIAGNAGARGRLLERQSARCGADDSSARLTRQSKEQASPGGRCTGATAIQPSSGCLQRAD